MRILIFDGPRKSDVAKAMGLSALRAHTVIADRQNEVIAPSAPKLVRTDRRKAFDFPANKPFREHQARTGGYLISATTP
ncbi:hypothetical protein J2D73_20115 [Acetobacter sacchari]|uniref:Transposase n=1 Tax=Acetobacter sacchari TaxID=2661687 RepID=A0ABS3M1J5_9PROT|nr:hypothetical protein [Acetobacter sacchari]MBO1362072.1 hypothetical protein [Acetobacter sacchari]MBO1362086.1 hypothetical protein [Acetobacter sacchari]